MNTDIIPKSEDQESVKLVKDLIRASCEYTKACNFNKGTKGKDESERKAVVKLLTRLLGRKPTDQEVNEARGY